MLTAPPEEVYRRSRDTTSHVSALLVNEKPESGMVVDRVMVDVEKLARRVYPWLAAGGGMIALPAKEGVGRRALHTTISAIPMIWRIYLLFIQ